MPSVAPTSSRRAPGPTSEADEGEAAAEEEDVEAELLLVPTELGLSSGAQSFRAQIHASGGAPVLQRKRTVTSQSRQRADINY